jgi:rubrerythrin
MKRPRCGLKMPVSDNCSTTYSGGTHAGGPAQELTEEKLRPKVKEDEDKARRRLFVLRIVQPGLAGLMDGSVSTLAPVFAAALATRNSLDAFLV